MIIIPVLFYLVDIGVILTTTMFFFNVSFLTALAYMGVITGIHLVIMGVGAIVEAALME